MKRIAAALLLGFALTGCGKGSLEEDWNGPPAARADGTMPVAAFNDYLKDYEDYASSPEALATEYLGLEHQQAAETSLVTNQAPEGGTTATVDATLSGLADDSVAASRYVLDLTKEKDGWRLRSASRTIRCQPGRGHEDFSAAPCI